MIGQIFNRSKIDFWAERNAFPRFIVITGREGFGKATMVKYITDKMKHYIIYADISVDSVREVIRNSYNVIAPTVYIFLNAHKMSAQAKNALLKVTEEPPNMAYFILTSNSMEQLLPTIESRCVHLPLEPYTEAELKEYCDADFIKYAQCPGDIEKLKTLDISKLEQLCDDIIEYCQAGLLSDAFILFSDMKFKDTDVEGYEVNIVISMLNYKLCEKYVNTGNPNYSLMSVRLNEARHKMNTYNISKENEFAGFLIYSRLLWCRS